MEWSGDVARGEWIVPRLRGWGVVGGTAPRGFEAYARILHPVPVGGWQTLDTVEESWSWADVARVTGRSLHPLVQWQAISGSQDQGVSLGDGWSASPPPLGFFDPRMLAQLAPLLGAATTTDAATLAIWNGWGCLRGGGMTISAGFTGSGPITADELHAAREMLRVTEEALRAERAAALSAAVVRAADLGPMLSLPGRDYVLLVCSLAELADAAWPRSAGIGWHGAFAGPMPQLIWPDDHAWLVASEIDVDSTIVGGSRALVDAVLAHPAFEAFEVQPDDSLASDADRINGPRAARDADSTTSA